MQLGGASASANAKLIANGSLTLGGTLTVNLVNSFLPLAGESFDIIDWTSLSNNAFPVILPTMGGRIVWDKSQLFTNGTISVTATYFTGDINRDGIVTVADVQALMNALTNLPTYQTSNSLTDPVLFRDVADVNGDGVINNADVQALINLIANNASGSSAISSVPEPRTIYLFAIAVSICGLTYRRREPNSSPHSANAAKHRISIRLPAS